MPLYDYRCKACGATTEVRHGAGEKYARACPACGSKNLQRVFNPAPIHFKGSGFYATDSKKKSEPPAAKKEEKPKAGDAKPGDAKPAETKSGETKSTESSPTKPSGESAA
jgi:putative FmdB family regulatory protein